MAKVTTTTEYISRHPEWGERIAALDDIITSSGLEPTVKWGVPVYTLGGKNLVGIACFKNHCALWFYNGSFLKDPAGVLHNANEEKTRGLRQWRFEKGQSIDAKLVRAYIAESVENQKQGKEIKPQKKKLEVPAELSAALKAEPALKSAFENLTPGKQREYADHIASAKREATRLSRLDKGRSMISAGRGLNDKYK